MSCKKTIQIKRLKGKDPVALLFEKGSEKRSSVLVLKYLKEEHSSLYFSGVAVPKRKIKKAVHRNRIKRLLREAIRKVAVDDLFSGSGLLLYTGTTMPELAHLSAAVQTLFKEIKSTS